MAAANIRYDVGTTHWPTESTLVQLDPALSRYDVKTGEKVGYEHVIVHVRTPATHPGNNGVDVFAATESGDPVHATMIPLDSFDYAPLHQALKQLGYDAAD